MKRVAGISVAIIISALYFVFATKWIPSSIFTAFFPDFHIIFIICVLLCFLFTVTLNDRILKTLFYAIPVLTGLVCLYINLFYIVTPQPDDGIHYVWMAKMIANGKIFLELPDFYEHYWNLYVNIYDGKYVSIFLPGFSFFMAPFAALGVPFLFNPLLAGLNAYLAGIHANALKDRKTAVIAMILFAFSSSHLLHGAQYFSHHFGLFLVLVSSYIILHKSYSFKRFLLAGSILSISLMVRPQNACYTYFAVAVLILFKYRSFRPLAGFTLPFIFTGSLLMGYNYYFTGDPFVFIQDIYFNAVNMRKFCHRPGFGKGCPGVQGTFLPVEGLNFDYASDITFVRLNNFLFQITAHPALLLFIIPAVIKLPYKYFLYYFMPLCAVVSYFPFYIEGSICGPRYLMESGALFLVVSSCGISQVIDYAARKKNVLGKLLIASCSGLIISGAIFFSVMFVKKNLFENEKVYNLSKIIKIIEDNNIENSIVMLPFSYVFHFHSILNVQDEPPHDRFGNLIMYSMGEVDENIQKFYKDSRYSSIWRISEKDDEYLLQELDFLEDNGSYKVEFELKFIPSAGQPFFVLPMLENRDSSEFSYSQTENVRFSMNALGVLFRAGGYNYYEFEHSVKKGGDYTIDLGIIATECLVEFFVEVNGIKTAHYKPDKHGISNEKIPFQTKLKDGKNRFRIVPVIDGCIVLDYMTINQRD
ncbi:MAG TPA: hypothetical protein PLD55_14910 [bacterium]|nr:hypothetical protein [bacterium]